MIAGPNPAQLLIVDDIEANRDLLARRVKRLGHDSGMAADGAAALALLREQDWDMVLLDITMPEMDGYETLRRIKADPATAHIPVIMVSAIDETESVVRCLELGADDYVTKPFNPVLLQARIEASLAKKRLADHRQEMLRALTRELEIGQKIQRGFLPEALPAVAGWQLAAHCEPARQVGGDFYDAFVLEDGRVALAIADVCDKGVGAALYMAVMRTMLRALLAHSPGSGSGVDIARTLAFVNDYIANEHGRDNMFATMFVGLLDPASGELAYANLGQDAPAIFRADDGATQRLPPADPALGLLPGLRPSVQRAFVGPGDRLLLYTDGVPESIGEAGEFGEDRLMDVARRSPGDALALVDAVVHALEGHAAGHTRHDDVTILAVRRLP